MFSTVSLSSGYYEEDDLKDCSQVIDISIIFYIMYLKSWLLISAGTPYLTIISFTDYTYRELNYSLYTYDHYHNELSYDCSNTLITVR